MRESVLVVLSGLCTMMLFCTAFAADPGKLKISVLCDDTVMSDQFVTEHGVSILIELPNGHRWLADTGTTDVYLENAKRMGANLDNLTGLPSPTDMMITQAALFSIPGLKVIRRFTDTR